MIFLQPLGLLGLIGIPILILVYILKNKFVEQILPSVYIWNLSERFIKRRNPLNRLTGIISLVLQLLLVTVISLSIAHPVLVLKGEAKEYVFLLDGSGSMSAISEEGSRLDRAKAQIGSVIEESCDGSTFTLVYVSDGTRVVYEATEDKEKAVQMLSDLAPVDSPASLTDAIGIVQGIFNKNSSALIYLLSDNEYDKVENLSFINLSAGEINHALSDVYFTERGGKVSVYGTVDYYSAEGELTVLVYADDAKEPISSTTVTGAPSDSVDFRIGFDLPYFTSLTVKVKEEDSLVKDDTVVLYNSKTENTYKALLVSDAPFFITSAISSVSAVEVQVVASKDYQPTKGFDLYIFDSFTPYDIPTDGAVWFFNPTVSTEGTGFSVQGVYEPGGSIELSLSSAHSSLAGKLLANMTGDGIFTSKYVKCGLYDNFTTLIEHKGNPVVFTGSNDFGNREVVFAFDLHDSNFPLLSDFIALFGNLIDFSFPTVLDRTEYTAGDFLSVNVVSGTDSIIVRSPSGEVTYLPIGDTVADMYLSESGIHEIELTSSGSSKKYYVFSKFSEAESDPASSGGELILLGEAGSEGIDGKYDNLILLFIGLMLLFCADWVVYCYEKYQLR